MNFRMLMWIISVVTILKHFLLNRQCVWFIPRRIRGCLDHWINKPQDASWTQLIGTSIYRLKCRFQYSSLPCSGPVLHKMQIRQLPRSTKSEPYKFWTWSSQSNLPPDILHSSKIPFVITLSCKLGGGTLIHQLRHCHLLSPTMFDVLLSPR